MIFRFSEPFFCDALRLAQFLAERHNGTISEGIGRSENFPKNEKFPSEDVRFLRVDGDEYYEIAFFYQDEPTEDDRKLRNKSFWRIRIGDTIRTKREEKCLSLKDLSDKIGLRVKALECIEQGRWEISIDQLGNICDALECSIILE
mgnify:CR=1 FL=1